MPMQILERSVGQMVRGTTRVVIIPATLMPDGVLDTAVFTGTGAVDVTRDAPPTITGFSGEQGDTPDPDLGTLKTGMLGAEITFPNSSLAFRLSKEGPTKDIRSVLHQGDEIYMLIADHGLVAGKTGDLIHATVKYLSKAREDILRINVPFSIHSVTEDVVIPALA